MVEAFVHGMILAFGLILPLGAQNVFIFNQGASQKTIFRALPAVITASVCDTFLILIAVLGISIIVFTFVWLKTTIFAIGFLFLIYMGWLIWKSNPPSMNDTKGGLSPKKQILFAVSVSLLNPHAILDIIGVIGTNSLHYSGYEKGMFSFATILISWIWFLGLVVAGRILGQYDMTGKWINIINKISAIMIWSVAIYMGMKVIV